MKTGSKYDYGRNEKKSSHQQGRKWLSRLFYLVFLLPFFLWGFFVFWWGSWPPWVCLTIAAIYAVSLFAVIIAAARRVEAAHEDQPIENIDFFYSPFKTEERFPDPEPGNSIIAINGDENPPEGDDGVVAYKSAHMKASNRSWWCVMVAAVRWSRM